MSPSPDTHRPAPGAPPAGRQVPSPRRPLDGPVVPVAPRTPRPAPPARRRPRRARLGRAWASAALGVLLLLTLVVVAVGLRSTSSPTTRADGSTTPVPPAPVGIREELVVTRVLPSGDLRVDHWIRSRRPLTGLSLSMPDLAAGAGSDVVRSGRGATEDATAEPAARGLVVVSDGHRQAGPTAVGRVPVTFFLAAARSVHVGYVVTDALQEGASVRGRALARLTSLEVDLQPSAVRRTVLVSGARVLAAACTPPGATAEPRPCGSARGTGWEVRLPVRARTATVSAQLDLD